MFRMIPGRRLRNATAFHSKSQRGMRGEGLPSLPWPLDSPALPHGGQSFSMRHIRQLKYTCVQAPPHSPPTELEALPKALKASSLCCPESLQNNLSGSSRLSRRAPETAKPADISHRAFPIHAITPQICLSAPSSQSCEHLHKSQDSPSRSYSGSGSHHIKQTKSI